MRKPHMTPSRPVRRHEASEPSFTFDTADFSVPIPETLPATQRSNALPFRRWFTTYADKALDGKQPHMFVPTRYWVEARNVAADKATEAYAKGKVRDQFATWRKSDEAPEGKERLQCITVARTGQEGIDGITEAGISVWLTATEKKAPK